MLLTWPVIRRWGSLGKHWNYSDASLIMQIWIHSELLGCTWEICAFLHIGGFQSLILSVWHRGVIYCHGIFSVRQWLYWNSCRWRLRLYLHRLCLIDCPWNLAATLKLHSAILRSFLFASRVQDLRLIHFYRRVISTILQWLACVLNLFWALDQLLN